MFNLKSMTKTVAMAGLGLSALVVAGVAQAKKSISVFKRLLAQSQMKLRCLKTSWLTLQL